MLSNAVAQGFPRWGIIPADFAQITGVATSSDTEHPSSTLEQRRSAERYRALARLVRGFVFEARVCADASIEFTWADDEFEAIFGCSREDINRLGWQSFVDVRDRATAQGRLIELIQGRHAEIELRIVSTAGEKRRLRMAAELLRDTTDSAPFTVIGMAEDITNRKNLIDHMFDVVHNEQWRIGADLHDGLGQVLTGVSLLLSSMNTRVLRGESIAPDEIAHLIGLVTGAIETTRGLAHGLAHATKELGGLAGALSALVRQFREVGLAIDLVIPDECGLELGPTVSDHLYRIVQEALTNIARHARADRAGVHLVISGKKLMLDMFDDGIGISAVSTSGFGLHSMRYRAEAIGAQLSIEPAVPRGTRVRVSLPL